MAEEQQDLQLSVSRRPPDIEDYVDMLRRQRAWIFGPTFAAVVVAVVVAFLWPDTYISTAVVRVVPPQVPETLVPTNVNLEMSQRINSMAQQILSRSTLTNIINSYGLYTRDRARLPMEDVVENMRKGDVRISNVVSFTTSEGRKAVPAFQISFSYDERSKAQKVCQDLVSRFVNENQRALSNQSTFTTGFLRDQLEMARRELETVEGKLARFRIQNAGKLPDQVQQNLQQLNALEQRLANLNSFASRINQDKLLMESQMRIARDQLNTLGSATTEVTVAAQNRQEQKNQQLARVENDILAWETRIAALKEVYTPSHPDVTSSISQLNVLKRNKEALEKAEAAAAAKKPEVAPPAEKRTITNPLIVREGRELEATIKRIGSAMEAKDIELEEVKREMIRIDALVKNTQARIDVTPLGEKENMDLTRERDLVRQRVEELNKKQSMSKVSDDLINRQQGENLELLDPASLPTNPAEPNRAIIVGIGAGLGLIIGLVMAGGRELKDTSIKNLKDVRAYTQLSILGSIPLLENDLVVRRRRRLSWLAWSTACIMGCLIMSGSMYYYFFVSKV